MNSVFRAEFVNGYDIRMIEGGSRERFLLETAQAVFIMCDIFRQNFQRDFPPQTRVFRQKDFAHPARAEQ